jgi:hypothetical protein
MNLTIECKSARSPVGDISPNALRAVTCESVPDSPDLIAETSFVAL